MECAGLYVSQDSGLLLPRAWLSPNYNFDDIGSAVMAMLRISSNKLEDIYRDSLDVTAINISPSPNHSQENSIFFVAYVVVVNFYIMNVFAA